MSYRVNRKGNCPYCEAESNWDATKQSQNHPSRIVRFCSSCNNYSILNTVNQAAYPLEDNQNPESVPMVKTL